MKCKVLFNVMCHLKINICQIEKVPRVLILSLHLKINICQIDKMSRVLILSHPT
jgi:hypothetical protein